MNSAWRTVLGTLLFALVTASTFTGVIAATTQLEPTLNVNPSSLVIKVGSSATTNLTLTNLPANGLRACFNVEGFPTSGFITSILPECANSPSGRILAVLRVEATPAAAPQRFTAFVVASNGNWTTRTMLNITVEPGMPAWIPWSIILAFALILTIPLVVKTKETKRRTRKQSR